MKLRARLTRLGGRWVNASFVREAIIRPGQDASSRVLIDGMLLRPDDAETTHYEILEATEEEVAMLCRCGYHFALAER
jgi:hypothetical protein